MPRFRSSSIQSDVVARWFFPAESTGTGKKQSSLALLEANRVTDLACASVAVVWSLKEHLEAELRQQGLWKLFTEVEMALVPVLVAMEENGILLDTDLLREMSLEMGKELLRLEKEIYSSVGHQFNINSPQQLGKVLFEDLRLPQSRRTKTGYSTDVEVLEELSPVHPLPAEVLKYRTLAKLKSTYVDRPSGPLAAGSGSGGDFLRGVRRRRAYALRGRSKMSPRPSSSCAAMPAARARASIGAPPPHLDHSRPARPAARKGGVIGTLLFVLLPAPASADMVKENPMLGIWQQQSAARKAALRTNIDPADGDTVWVGHVFGTHSVPWSANTAWSGWGPFHVGRGGYRVSTLADLSHHDRQQQGGKHFAEYWRAR